MQPPPALQIGVKVTAAPGSQVIQPSLAARRQEGLIPLVLLPKSPVNGGKRDRSAEGVCPCGASVAPSALELRWGELAPPKASPHGTKALKNFPQRLKISLPIVNWEIYSKL